MIKYGQKGYHDRKQNPDMRIIIYSPDNNRTTKEITAVEIICFFIDSSSVQYVKTTTHNNKDKYFQNAHPSF